MIGNEVMGLLSQVSSREPTVVERTAAGAFLAQFYNGIENIMKRFVKNLDGQMPTGDTWHIDLARMFAEPAANGMPVFFSQDRFPEIADYRKCRHAVRNSYGHDLVWSKLKPMMERLPHTLKWFKN